MKKSDVQEIIKNLFEEDESLKYALATNLAKYGRPQSKKSDKPAKLTKGLEKGREKYVKDLKKAGLDEIEGVPTVSPAEASKIHKFITNKLRIAVNDYNESLGTNDKPIRMSFFEQEFPSTSQFYDILNQALTENNITEQVKNSFKLSDLEFETVSQIFGGTEDKLDDRLSFASPYDLNASLNIPDKKTFDMWKRDFLKKYGESEIILDPEAEFYPLQVKVNNEKYNKARELFGRAMANDTGLDEATKEYGQKLDKKFFIKLKGKDVTYMGKNHKVVDADENILTLKDDEGNTRTVNYNMFTKSGFVAEDNDKPDRCLRIARRKIPQSSAYRSGLIVKCRKGMIWKNEK